MTPTGWIKFVVDLFRTQGLSEKNARDASAVLIKADVLGIESHGVPRLRNYITRLQNGQVEANPEVVVVREMPSTALVDGANGLGMVVGQRAMEIAIKKAEVTGAGFVSVRNSSHYGIAGYYARMALEHDMIGFSMTNVGAGGDTPPTAWKDGPLWYQSHSRGRALQDAAALCDGLRHHSCCLWKAADCHASEPRYTPGMGCGRRRQPCH